MCCVPVLPANARSMYKTVYQASFWVMEKEGKDSGVEGQGPARAADDTAAAVAAVQLQAV